VTSLVNLLKHIEVRVTLRPTVSRPVCRGYQAHISGPSPGFCYGQLRVCWSGPSFVTRRQVCRLQLLRVLGSGVILSSESRGIHDQILLSQIRDFPTLVGQVPVFISLRNWVAQLYPQELGHLKDVFVLNYIHKFSSYCRRNTLNPH
jgi:hypothetical protein